MWLVYLDESKDNNSLFVYSALIVKGDRWSQAFDAIKLLRRNLRRDYGIFIAHELHAWKFAAGKGIVSDRVLNKQLRAKIFKEILEFIAGCGYFGLISSVNTNEQFAFERLMNRINRTAHAKGQDLLLFCDQGQESSFTKRIRKLRVHNPIPSSHGVWHETGMFTRNIPLHRFIEDPVFKDSKSSYFIQAVDFIAYALLRMERPIPSRTILGYDGFYKILQPITTTATNPRDSRGLGIIR